ncbi:hypothetical protein BDM02DRAFT_3122854 [Thelephora ganbajun]|uniref:Uncharacterized protein n=1 Tax=Thelephora ganbajun TaxID=370292 RepID=A0ACB6Z394_THEGA|nr:hypothetical protein BDM02DRAFT_3122854 [Thelephora ganbajun]
MPRSKSREKKTSAAERGEKVEGEREGAQYRGRSFEDEFGDYGYPDFRGYEFGDARYNSFPRMQGAPVRVRPSAYDPYEGYDDREIPTAFGQPQHAHRYPGGRDSFSYGEDIYGEGVGYDKLRRFSAPIPNHDPYPGPQPQYREATSLPDIRMNASVEEQIDELLEAVERSSLADSDVSLSLDGISKEVDHQLLDVRAGKRREGGVGDPVVECVALEDLPPVIQTIAIAREDARLGLEDETGHGTPEIEDVAPMLVDLFDLAQLLAQEAL